jgi:hypothetical protein
MSEICIRANCENSSGTKFPQYIRWLFLALAVMALPECAATTLSKKAQRQNIHIVTSENELQKMEMVHAYIAKSNEPIEKLRILLANEAADNALHDITVFVRYVDTETSTALVSKTTTIPKAVTEPKGNLLYREKPLSCNENNYVYDTKLVSETVTMKRYEISYWQ